jgi:hypothetical protein
MLLKDVGAAGTDWNPSMGCGQAQVKSHHRPDTTTALRPGRIDFIEAINFIEQSSSMWLYRIPKYMYMCPTRQAQVTCCTRIAYKTVNLLALTCIYGPYSAGGGRTSPPPARSNYDRAVVTWATDWYRHNSRSRMAAMQHAGVLGPNERARAGCMHSCHWCACRAWRNGGRPFPGLHGAGRLKPGRRQAARPRTIKLRDRIMQRARGKPYYPCHPTRHTGVKLAGGPL